MDQSVYQTYQIKPVVARVESSIRSLSSWQQDFVILRQEIGIQMFEAKAKVKRQQTEIGLESQRLQAELSLKSQRLEREIEDLNHLEKTMVEELIEAAGERIEKLKMMARLANRANKEIATKDFPVTAEQWPEKRKLVVNPPARPICSDIEQVQSGAVTHEISRPITSAGNNQFKGCYSACKNTERTNDQHPRTAHLNQRRSDLVQTNKGRMAPPLSTQNVHTRRVNLVPEPNFTQAFSRTEQNQSNQSMEAT